ncbi:hypothetical protein EA462_00100 [Natrarchaeobius halalkaliphilus]|uniref:Uncharacterized protein n=1 Tax=Natrarchaeobius halalkaliphilus TaxID=1679091 RepID=A0A3N6P8Z6_9EURY|nr:hypothetical protein [Natrarchaeobius halalkaliphilus]RQG92675.1 hypothetical protein EA462_00100 [Natrarchaeobius halalkaliphilus]
MNSPGILWMVQTAAGLSMAGPMFVVGFEFLRGGRTVAGVGFFALGVVALYFPTYLLNRIGGPRAWIRRRLGRSGSDADDTDEEGATTEVDRSESSPLDRLRRR